MQYYWKLKCKFSFQLQSLSSSQLKNIKNNKKKLQSLLIKSVFKTLIFVTARSTYLYIAEFTIIHFVCLSLCELANLRNLWLKSKYKKRKQVIDSRRLFKVVQVKNCFLYSFALHFSIFMGNLVLWSKLTYNTVG